ncbi:MAG: DNA helicase RecQ [Candidatus Magasanikbacteria bacterium]|nr:DNA helicase RecQ [Candidatus Magasanikbacteria bacterium]MBT4071870.1 DNA helicase RecQ [Candidatus Magasanikbacteria bacterium]
MTIQEALKTYFGYHTFRPMQQNIIESVLAKKDTVVLMPTGGGKSLCYQIPAIVMPGVCIVVSPLIALMKDQVEGLVANGVAADYLNSTLSYDEQQDVKDAVQRGEISLLYVSPEKLVSQDFLYFLHSIPVNLFAVDEAHCISSWGHDFRPEYTRLALLKQQFPEVPIIALTATADRLTRLDITAQLKLENPKVSLASFDRPNLKLTVLPGKNRMKKIVSYVEKKPQESGIIYCLSRKSTERVAASLRSSGVKAMHYHAGMHAHDREKAQTAFIKGETPVICATIAFGMGIDKSNVRYVIHYNLPKNIEAYYQEIGRAGRDGLPSDTILFYTFSDVILLRRFVEQSGQKSLQMAKLERMQQYADAFTCRRKILLHYFNESLAEDCGNCDVCKSPPKVFDGTVLAQKALSAIVRLKQEVAVNILIDVLRGSKRHDVLSRGYDQIPTFGAGSDVASEDWRQYLLQMLNLGLIDVAYERQYALTITEQGKKVLRGDGNVSLVHLSSINEKQAEREKQAKVKTHREEFGEILFQELRTLRSDIANKEDIPPYLVFTDASLDNMVQSLPKTKKEFRMISGVGDKKLERYGELFIDKIIHVMADQRKIGKNIKGSTQMVTYEMFRKGMAVPTIARERKLKGTTIYSHLAELYEKGHDINISQFLDKSEIKILMAAIETCGVDARLKKVYNKLDGKIDYGKIRLGMAKYKMELKEKGIILV